MLVKIIGFMSRLAPVDCTRPTIKGSVSTGSSVRSVGESLLSIKRERSREMSVTHEELASFLAMRSNSFLKCLSLVHPTLADACQVAMKDGSPSVHEEYVQEILAAMPEELPEDLQEERPWD
jgi:hypothetical protein